MLSRLRNYARSCFRPVRRYTRMNRDDLEDYIAGDDSGIGETFIWFKDLEKHCFGDFSFAVVRGNEVIEDHSQVETGNGAVFVGVYDGHGGTAASSFVADDLFANFIRIANENGGISELNLRRAIAATEEEFLNSVGTRFGMDPLIAATGTCCLVGVISGGILFTANLGDSRAVVGSMGMFNTILTEQLTTEHNAKIKEVRQELRLQHPTDTQIVVCNNGTWRVKGIIQVSRAIGDAFLKRSEFSLNAYPNPKFYLPEGLPRPVLSAEPSIYMRVLRPKDKFVIFASDGLWEYLTNEQAVQIVHEYPRTGIARRLAKTALNLAAKDNEITYERLRRAEGPYKRSLHDDITVVVLFIDHERLVEAATVPQVSTRGFVDVPGPSRFTNLR